MAIVAASCDERMKATQPLGDPSGHEQAGAKKTRVRGKECERLMSTTTEHATTTQCQNTENEGQADAASHSRTVSSLAEQTQSSTFVSTQVFTLCTVKNQIHRRKNGLYRESNQRPSDHFNFHQRGPEALTSTSSAIAGNPHLRLCQKFPRSLDVRREPTRGWISFMQRLNLTIHSVMVGEGGRGTRY